MRWAMRAKSSASILAIAIWWVLVNLPWLSVGAEEFTGGQLIPVLNLLPAIAITALFISLYGKLRRFLIASVAVILGFGAYISLSVDLSTSAVVIAELERVSGVLNPQSHEAGVAISEQWGKFASVATNSLALIFIALSFTSNKARSDRDNGDEESSDNRSLWDEQN